VLESTQYDTSEGLLIAKDKTAPEKR